MANKTSVNPYLIGFDDIEALTELKTSLFDAVPKFLAKSKWYDALAYERGIYCGHTFFPLYVVPLAEFVVSRLDEGHNRGDEEDAIQELTPPDQDILRVAAIHYCHIHGLEYTGKVPGGKSLSDYLDTVVFKFKAQDEDDGK
ncbi:hypothetical protein VNI00_016096 [Paramarasmius palmivorus]|uniref:Uncharacterized protein n=1 Tax=Paramarasmius palmivorus TaxID=297713 RepID=A0AAW0BJE1_9AGAR